jgi:hypothetical protein
MRGGVIKHTVIIALDGFDGTAKLCRDINKKKFDKVKKVLDLTRKEKVYTK